MSEPIAIVIGAGVAGLSCARELNARGVTNVVFERARGVGGRCATRRVGNQPVDFGLPFLHAKSGEFGEALNALDPEGKVLGWPLAVREPRLALLADALKPGRRRMARRAGVSEFPKWLARGCDVRLAKEAVALEECDGAVAVRFADSAHAAAPFVILACHPGESRRLAEPLVREWPDAAAKLERLRAVEPTPVLTLIAGYDPDAFDVPFDVWHPLETTMLHSIVHDSAKRSEPAERTSKEPAERTSKEPAERVVNPPAERVLVLHARARFSRERLHADPREWEADLLWELGEVMGPRAASPRWTQAHAWSEAFVPRAQQLPEAMVFESGRGACVGLIGDAFAVDPGVEGAYMSGISFAEQIAIVRAVRAGRM